MPERSSAGFEIGVRTKLADVQTLEPEPFRIAIFGDFSGRANRGTAETGRSAGPIAIDRDNFDRVFAKLAPALHIAGTGPQVSIRFDSLDDFHPDSLFRRLPLFATLRDLRTRLDDPATFRETAAELARSPGEPSAAAPGSSSAREPAPKQGPASYTGGNLLDRMLEQSDEGAPLPQTVRPDDLQAFLDHIVAGHLVRNKNPQHDQLLAHIDKSIADEMRALLHHPDFQALEAGWRALFFLTHRLETGVDLQIHLFDLSKRELSDDLNGASDLRATAFYRNAVTSAAAEPWTLLIGNFSFDARPEDIELLARVAMTAHQAGAPFLAAASSAVLGCDSLQGMPDPRDWDADPSAAEFWRALRELPEASSIGLLMPRFLLRLPYGKETSPIDEFPFEEMPGTPEHNSYLWGNPAVVAACLLGRAFSEEGWSMRPGSAREIGGLPLHIYERDGESVAQPCAEAWLSDRAAEFILQLGVIPLLCARNSDRILLLRFQSLADPPKALAARW
jgi:type VI secretion system protein ImpC